MAMSKPRKGVGSGSGTSAARTASGGISAKQVLDKVAASKFAKNPVVKSKIARARKVDRGGK